MSLLKKERKKKQVRVFARYMARELLPAEATQVSGGGSSWCHIDDSCGDTPRNGQHIDDTAMITD